MASAPQLMGNAQAAVEHRGGHLQIIASAGSGKTEVVAQRIASLFSFGASPEEVVAFTFNEAAAEELKTRIEDRVAERLGLDYLNSLNGCFIGTIHSYCFQMLQRHVPVFETYDVLDEHGLSAFLSVESNRIQLKDLDNRLFRAIRTFRTNIDVVENELLELDQLDGDFGEVAKRYYEELRRRRLLTYGQQIAHAVQAFERGDLLERVHSSLRFLVVDEYQDINPAQERLIELLASGPVELCVVGDDDQSIYQWRGADVRNIVEFEQRYGAKQYPIVTNRRSRPGIVDLANRVSENIQGRLEKKMLRHRPACDPDQSIWVASTEKDEADAIADAVKGLHKQGRRYGDIAILVRGRVSYTALLEALKGLPVTTGGGTGLFNEPLALLFGRTLAFLADTDWSDDPYGDREAVTLDTLVQSYVDEFGLDQKGRRRVQRLLDNWKSEVSDPTRPADLVGDYYLLLEACGVLSWDPGDPLQVARLGTIARCSRILADFESVQRRSRPDTNNPGEQIGGQDRGQFFFFWLAIFVQNYAHGAYEGFEGEDDIELDAVTLTTVHQAKGREWPIVFVPSVTARRFPSSMTGRAGTWFIPDNLFDPTRYEGTNNDERRLFYVAVTRARDWLSLSAHERVTETGNRVGISPFLLQLGGKELQDRPTLPKPPNDTTDNQEPEPVALSFSELADFLLCPYAFRLRHRLGFQPQIAQELGYGKAVHHTLRRVAEHYRDTGVVPSNHELERMFDGDFYLPYASKPAHLQLKASARRLIDRYIEEYSADLDRVWEVERPFELHLDNAVISGRADVILDREDGSIHALALVDYKTSTLREHDFDLQLQVYASAGRREGLNVAAAYVHDLAAADRLPVDIGEAAIGTAEKEVSEAIGRFREADFAPTPSRTVCGGCDMRPVCRYRAP